MKADGATVARKCLYDSWPPGAPVPALDGETEAINAETDRGNV